MYSAAAQLSEGGQLFILADLELSTPLEFNVGLLVASTKADGGGNIRYDMPIMMAQITTRKNDWIMHAHRFIL